MRVMLNDVIVSSAEKVVIGVRKVEYLVSKALQAILKAQKEAHAKYIILHRAKYERLFAEAQTEINEVLENAKAKAERISFEADNAYYDALEARCKLIDKRDELDSKIRKGI